MDLSSYFVCLNGVIRITLQFKNEAQRWSGIAFEMRGNTSSHHLGKCQKLSIHRNIHQFQILKVGSRDWQTFVEDYFRYLIWLILFQGQRSSFFRLPKKCCVLAIMTSMWGWLWIRFWGFSTLIKKVFFPRV